MDFAVKITSGARKHGISRKRIEQALINQSFSATLSIAGSDPKVVYLGNDDKGMEIEIIAVVLPGLLLVIHAMPTHYRRRNR